MEKGRKYKKNIIIDSVMSSYCNCCCDMCFKTDYVIKVNIPHTKYHDGFRLTTKYSPLWICESCRDKLVKAISLPYPHDTRQTGGKENAAD